MSADEPIEPTRILPPEASLIEERLIEERLYQELLSKLRKFVVIDPVPVEPIVPKPEFDHIRYALIHRAMVTAHNPTIKITVT